MNKKKTIYKYEIQLRDRQIIRAPTGANFLSVQMQRETLCIWAVVDPEQKLEDYVVYIQGTGKPIEYNLDVLGKFLGTVQQCDGRLVWHIFIIQNLM